MKGPWTESSEFCLSDNSFRESEIFLQKNFGLGRKRVAEKIGSYKSSGQTICYTRSAARRAQAGTQ